ncbi:neurogenic differentiation factor 1 [Contarinia nasturtii]|uniref:neurogenic differentiation factor 1 n=1 Tax=Contarinia nasturtii TaxID=265458 RepID=UPI0012D3C62F|nr:neurogenic differentiation factor 1 [Contarinia nasturtii]
MSRKRAASPSHIEDFDDEYGEDSCSSGSKSQTNSLPVQRNAANARERARMRVLSSAFCRLKTKLPWVPVDTKLSKLDTLRLATIYIQQLRTCLATGQDLYYTSNELSRFDTNTSTGQNQTSLVWPFTFQQQQQQQQQQNVLKVQESISSNRPKECPTVWYERDAAMSNHYNVNFYSSISNVTNSSSYEHDKYDYRHDNSLRTEHG